MEKNSQQLTQLLAVVKQLRDPEKGCSWDRKQTFKTIAPYILEEAYEVVDAIDKEDKEALCDELGDLLLQIVLISQIAVEQQQFTFEDVMQGVIAKMVRRHPHVFGNTPYTGERDQKKLWESIKQTERMSQQQSGTFAGLSAAMPALQSSQKIQKRAARLGFDWKDWSQVIPKIHEELQEVTEAVEAGESFERIEEEVGDVLMAASNLARQLSVNAENALRLSNKKFQKRFEEVEKLLIQSGIDIEAATLEQMDAAWEQAKHHEKQVIA